MTDILIFSKDRACQLDLLLSSLKEEVKNFSSITVLFLSSNEFFDNAYKICKKEHPEVRFEQEFNFKQQVVSWINDSSRAYASMMLVDDIVFKEELDLNEIAGLLTNNKHILCYSPRLGLHLTDCYTMDEKNVEAPNGNLFNEYFAWDWTTGRLDWNYPMSVDGHVFRTSELASWITYLGFNNPNTLEASMQQIQYYAILQQIMICNRISKLVNIPMNRVQNTFQNKFGKVSHVELNECYLNGKRLDKEAYHKVLNRGCHEDLEVVWVNK